MKLQDLFEAKATLGSTIARCKPYLSMPGAKTGFLYRGLTLPLSSYTHETVKLENGSTVYIDWAILKRRTERRPTSTPENYADAADDFFYEKFGWRARSASTFATAYEAETPTYGDTHIMLPIGKTRFVWSDYVRDMYEMLNAIHRVEKFRTMSKERREQFFVQRLGDSHYQSDGLGGAIKSGHEIMFDCNSYLVVLVDISSSTTNDEATRKYIKDLTGIA